MEHTRLTLARTFILAMAASAFTFGASQAHASDTTSIVNETEGKIWVHEKAAVSETPRFVRNYKAVPKLIVPLNTDIQMNASSEAKMIYKSNSFSSDIDLSNFDLVEDSPVFIGTSGQTEFDTRDAQRDSGAYPETMDVNPLYTVAGAGVSTSF